MVRLLSWAFCSAHVLADPLDESSMLQMPVVQKSVESDASDCACPGYFEEQCQENAFQGCVWTADNLGHHGLGWTDQGESNAPWCQCDPNFDGPPPLFRPPNPEPWSTDPVRPGGPEVPRVPADGDLRLSGGSDSQGRLEIYHEGEWGTICDDHFDHNDASVACVQLGFSANSAHSIYTHGGGSGTIFLDDLGCNAEEERLEQCDHRGWRSHNCGHHEDVGVICNARQLAADAPGSEGDLRLNDGTSDRGRLEIYHDGVWGTICDDHFAINDASTACRQLGFSHGAALSYTHGGGSGAIHLDDLGCGAVHDRIVDCSHLGWGSHNCGHHEDVGVECITDEDAEAWAADGSEGDLRLSDGSSTRGRLEIYRMGVWGTICDDHFDMTDAATACRQLGFPNGATSTYTHGGGSGTIHMDDLGCSTENNRIDQCDHRGWGSHNCQHHEDVGVECAA